MASSSSLSAGSSRPYSGGASSGRGRWKSIPTRKPLVACLMGEASLSAAFAAAHTHQIPAYTFPEEAAAALEISTSAVAAPFQTSDSFDAEDGPGTCPVVSRRRDG